MGVTIKDIAKRTGLSITTISLVLNKKENRIPEKTRQIIESAAQELNYSPNQVAVSLSTKKSNLIGLVIPRGTSYYFANLVSSIERACRNAGYSLGISLPESDGDSCLEAIQEMLHRGVDGVIFDPSNLGEDFYRAYIDMVFESDTPISSLAGAGAHLLSNSVIPDYKRGGFLAASHLLELGHRRIGFIAGSRENYAVSDLLLGVEEALEEKGMGGEALPVLFGANTAAFGREGLDSLLEAGGPTGVIAASDSIAAGILRRAFEMGIHVPRQLSVLGYGNSSAGAEYQVSLTTVSIHYDRIARKAVNLIKKLTQNGSARTPELIAPSLIVRESTAAPGTA
ncbi:MAG: LacI family transcriptional regulator [Treponema sp.]|jgi:LacI family transcriptional regulator|nr:LacI family transcriptional regulator [Treponema sp.]